MRHYWTLLFVIVGVLVIDQATKWAVITSLQPYEMLQPVPALVPYFQITYTQNTGSAFGFLPQAGDLFLIVAVVVVIAMIFFYPRVPAHSYLTRFAIGLICGGALGNALDRVQHGHVVDFIHYQIPGLIPNVSNLADHAIVLGVMLIFIEGWLADRQKKLNQKVALETETRDDVS